MPWFVLYTKPRAEKKTAEQLARMGVEVYCPVVRTMRQWSDRKKKVDIPLFSSYLFVNLTEEERNVVFRASGVVRYLFWLGKPAVVRQEEIDTIREWLDEKEVEEVHLVDIQKGDRVVIETGLFKDETAMVAGVSRQFVNVRLESLGWEVQIYYRDLKRVPKGK